MFALQLFLNAQVAQSVEQRTENPRVGGSIPPLGTTVEIKEFQRLISLLISLFYCLKIFCIRYIADFLAKR
jgi:hypothetical protein